ncbi:MAG: right-handed parallel beta-helix repeat-containing protein [Anaerolineales bacterium]|nr:right-handed parallel beta-helix repeat-containing protein [Anaerolineales bacterium]
MWRRLALFVLFPLIVLACQRTPLTATTAQAAPTSTIYHVATNGNDASNGAANTPWRTIQHAVDSINPGDTIWVHNGTYVGARIEQSGSDTQWLTLMAAPGENPVLDGPGPNNRHNSTLELETWEGSLTVSYWVIEGLEVTGASGWGIDMRGTETAHSHHLTIRGNRVHDNGWPTTSTGIFSGFVDHVIVEDNESYNNGEHGVYLSNSGDFPIVRRNRVHDNAAGGIQFNGDLSAGGDGIISDGLIEANIIYENGAISGGAAINLDGARAITVRNNILYENHAGGIAIFQINGGICSQEIAVLNNTFLMAADGRWAVNVAGTGCINNKVFNNILYNQHSWRGSIVVAAPNITGFESDYNVIMDRFSIDDGDTRISLSEWQGLGYDTHSFIATPAQLFLNAAAADFHLLPTSPALNQGLTLPAVTDDFEGQPRPFGPAYDIGADEYMILPFSVYLPLATRS